uniref:Transmembrane 4 L6 family member 1-like n=1 Tax=Pundamilia nyererei TaxID=303518 RepID=A0A3B4G9F6_9CICH
LGYSLPLPCSSGVLFPSLPFSLCTSRRCLSSASPAASVIGWGFKRDVQDVEQHSDPSLCFCSYVNVTLLAAVVGLVGSAYCFIVSGYALLQGPQCFTSYGWSYPFADQKGRYLLQPETWTRCLQPVNIIEWNITLLCVLLGLAVLEFIICLLQLGNGLVNAVCRPCCYKQEYSLNA